MSENFYIQMAGIVTLFVINYLKVRADNGISRRRSDESHQLLTVEINEVKEALKGINLSREFEKSLFDTITKKAFDIIAANSDLSDNVIHILNSTQIRVRSFAIKHSESPYRRNKSAIRNYLKIESQSIKDDVKHIANDFFPETKEGLDYDSFIYKHTNIVTTIGVMLQRLAENGLSKDKYISLFEDFTSDLLIEQIKGWRLWVRTK